jgi:hypothetical protein
MKTRFSGILMPIVGDDLKLAREIVGSFTPLIEI